jgi:hypothetical protein
MKRVAVLSWFAAFAMMVAYVLLPGPSHYVFSGAPLASKGLLVFYGLITCGVLTLFYRPIRPARLRWIAALAAIVVTKIVLASFLISSGWRGYYWTSAQWTKTGRELRLASFLTDHRIRDYRLDRQLAFDSTSFGLDFLNDLPPEGAAWEFPTSRDKWLPLVVHWHGWIYGPAQHLSVTAIGTVRVSVSGHSVLTATNPIEAPFTAEPGREVVVEYEKPTNATPSFVMSGVTAEVTPWPASAQAMTRSRWTGTAMNVLGFVGFAILFMAFTDAYPRLTVLALEDIWTSPSAIAAVLFFAFFFALGVGRTIPLRHATMLEGLGDDTLAYEGQARQIVRGGLLMVNAKGHGEPYYFYPLYPYAVAGAHLLFGEDFANVILINYIFMALLGPLFWLLLRKHVSTGAVVATLIFLALFVYTFMIGYCGAAFSDNLYAPLVVGVVVAAIAALERKSVFLLCITGVLTAFGAATRPSFLLFVPFFGLWLLFDRDLGNFFARIRAGFSFGLGFAIGVSPFTIRNWIVARKFVLLVSSFIMLPFFLTPPEKEATDILWEGRLPSFFESLRLSARIISRHPLDVLWLEFRKVAFTFGFTQFGPAGGVGLPRSFIILTALVALALWSRRVPRPVAKVLIVFGLSHLAAVVLGTPWTYGYKTILPLHLLFLASAAFLLPDWGDVKEVDAVPAVLSSSRRKRTVSVVLPTYNEKDSIRQVIDDFFASGVVDEVIVVNNNAAEGTSEAVAGSGAREVFENRQGYGAAIRRGLREATGELIVVCEPDGTFLASDIHKLLSYADDFDVVYGSRTSQQLVWRGANMGTFLRWGNWAVAKYLEFLYNATSLTDVGCTMRMVRRDVASALAEQFTVDGSQFGPEMMILTLRAGYRVIQIPVNYRPRVGVSAVTGDPAKAFLLGLQMIWLITTRRLRDYVRKPRDARVPAVIASEVQAQK